MEGRHLFYGGKIFGEKGADALLTENGRILAVGKREELAEAGGGRTDLEGAWVLPAFLDAHSHFTQTAYSFLQVSLEGAASEEELEERIRAYIRREGIAPGQWVKAGNYDHNRMPGGRNPSLAALDRAAPENPLLIQHRSGHMGLMNSAALSRMGITEKTPSPEGGRIETRDGKLTGYLEENALFLYQRKIPGPEPDALAEAYGKAQASYGAHGITTVQEGMLVKEMFPAIRMLLGRRLLYLDLAAYASVGDYPAVKEEFAPYLDGYREHFRIGGIKIFLDGSPQGRTAWLREPYLGSASCGYGTMSDAEVKEAMVLAAQEQVQLLAHCNGDAAIAQFLRCLAWTKERYPGFSALRPVIIHGQLMGKDQVREAARLGAFVSFFPAHIRRWGDVHIRNLGMERASGISPAGSALAQGLPFTFHQDTPVLEPDMWETVRCAAVRRTESGILLGEEERIPVEEALRAVTISAARQYGEEREKGSLEPGKNADFILTDRDPLETDPEEIQKIRLLKTFCRGECVFSGV